MYGHGLQVSLQSVDFHQKSFDCGVCVQMFVCVCTCVCWVCLVVFVWWFSFVSVCSVKFFVSLMFVSVCSVKLFH